MLSEIEQYLEGNAELDELDDKSEVSGLNADIANELVNAVIDAGVQKKVILQTAMQMMDDDQFRQFINEVTLQARIRNDEIVSLLDRLNQAT